ncbi:MAG: energy transducer TonB [Candidatus Kapaibacteriota bacterium]
MQANTPPNDRERLEHLMISAVYDEISGEERRELDTLLRRFPSALDELLALEDLRRFITKPPQALVAHDNFYHKQWSRLDAVLRQENPNIPRSIAIPKNIRPTPSLPTTNRPLIRASELKRVIPIATERGFIGASLLFSFCIGAYSLFLVVNAANLGKSPRINAMKLTNLPPPSVQNEIAPPPPPLASNAPLARAGTPVPVPDALIAPEVKDFANVDEISRAGTTGGDGNDQGFLGLASDVDTEVREDEPNAYDFVPVEKEPYIDIRDLQKRVVYPDIAKRAGIEGKVNIRVLVGKNGMPKKSLIESSDSDLLNEAAVKAVMKSIFTPAIQNNQPIDCWVSIPIVFRLR